MVNHSLDGLVPKEDTQFSKFCRDLRENDDPSLDTWTNEFEASADLHIMGRVHYQHLAESIRLLTDHPWADLFNAARKVVFSRTLKTADWANTTIASGDLAEEVDKFRRGGDGYILVSGGISFWRSLARLNLIDEYRVTLVPYLAAADGTRLFDDAGNSRQLDLVSSTAFDNGMIGLQYRRHR